MSSTSIPPASRERDLGDGCHSGGRARDKVPSPHSPPQKEVIQGSTSSAFKKGRNRADLARLRLGPATTAGRQPRRRTTITRYLSHRLDGVVLLTKCGSSVWAMLGKHSEPRSPQSFWATLQLSFLQKEPERV